MLNSQVTAITIACAVVGGLLVIGIIAFIVYWYTCVRIKVDLRDTLPSIRQEEPTSVHTKKKADEEPILPMGYNQPSSTERTLDIERGIQIDSGVVVDPPSYRYFTSESPSARSQRKQVLDLVAFEYAEPGDGVELPVTIGKADREHPGPLDLSRVPSSHVFVTFPSNNNADDVSDLTTERSYEIRRDHKNKARQTVEHSDELYTYSAEKAVRLPLGIDSSRDQVNTENNPLLDPKNSPNKPRTQSRSEDLKSNEQIHNRSGKRVVPSPRPQQRPRLPAASKQPVATHSAKSPDVVPVNSRNEVSLEDILYSALDDGESHVSGMRMGFDDNSTAAKSWDDGFEIASPLVLFTPPPCSGASESKLREVDFWQQSADICNNLHADPLIGAAKDVINDDGSDCGYIMKLLSEALAESGDADESVCISLTVMSSRDSSVNGSPKASPVGLAVPHIEWDSDCASIESQTSFQKAVRAALHEKQSSYSILGLQNPLEDKSVVSVDSTIDSSVVIMYSPVIARPSV
jgi:hypothetical protein